jgi:hypothetical protein
MPRFVVSLTSFGAAHRLKPQDKVPLAAVEFCVKSDQANTISEVYVREVLGGYLKHAKLPMNIHWSDK